MWTGVLEAEAEVGVEVEVEGPSLLAPFMALAKQKADPGPEGLAGCQETGEGRGGGNNKRA